jgi:hypothetical protein
MDAESLCDIATVCFSSAAALSHSSTAHLMLQRSFQFSRVATRSLANDAVRPVSFCFEFISIRLVYHLMTSAVSEAHSAVRLPQRARRQDGAVRRLGDAGAVQGGCPEVALAHSH